MNHFWQKQHRASGRLQLWMTTILFAVTVNSHADFNAGSGRAVSGQITNDACISSIGGITEGPDTENKSGFIGQIYDVSELLITATPSNVSSGGFSTLSFSALLDDSTVIILSPEEVSWDTPVFPIATITASGQLTASTVSSTTSGTVEAHYQNVSGKTSITVSPQILPPVVTNQIVVVGINSSQTIQLNGNDPQGLPLSFVIQTPPAHGQLGPIQESQVLYIPDTNFTGVDQFTFFASNSVTTSSVGTVFITISKLDQTISFDTLPTRFNGDPPFKLVASASSGLPVAFAIVNGPARISEDILTITGTGSITVRATQAGNTIYNAAPLVEQTFHVISPVGHLILVKRFPGTNVVNIATNVLASSGSTLVSCDVKAENGGTIAIKSDHLAFTPASIYGSDYFNYILRSSSGLTTNTVIVCPIEDMQNDVLYIVVEAEDFVLGFAGVSQGTYEILHSDDLLSWSALGNATETAPGIFQFRNASPQSMHRFYRFHKK